MKKSVQFQRDSCRIILFFLNNSAILSLLTRRAGYLLPTFANVKNWRISSISRLADVVRCRHGSHPTGTNTWNNVCTRQPALQVRRSGIQVWTKAIYVIDYR